MRYQKLDLAVIAREFKDYVLRKKRFRNRNLNSSVIAQELGVSRTILSRAVNQELGTTINAFITSQRMKYADKLLQSNTHGLTHEQIILLSGFSCPSTYYRQLKIQLSKVVVVK